MKWFEHSTDPSPHNIEPSRRSFVKKVFPFVTIAAFGGKKELSGVPLSEKELGERLAYARKRASEAQEAIASGDLDTILRDPYATSSFLYSRQFFDAPRPWGSRRDFQGQMISEVARSTTPEIRRNFFTALALRCKEHPWTPGSERETVPLDVFDFGKGRNHNDAIDLFTQEGTIVRAMARGMVVVAENGWKEEDRFSTSSWLGGNTAIVFGHDRSEIVRYAHLGAVGVEVGEMVSAAREIGEVGNTGQNAILPGRGRHLHLEVNRYDAEQNEVFVVSTLELQERIKTLRKER